MPRGRGSQIGAKSDRVPAPVFDRISINRLLQPRARLDVFAQVDQWDPDQPIGDRPGLWVAKTGNAFVRASDHQSVIEREGASREQPQTKRRSLLIVEIHECLREKNPPG